MCLLAILYKIVPDYPLIVAANRDEDPGRGGEPPGKWPDGISAPRDPRSGGTWFGVNSSGVFSALTNRAGPAATGAQVKSRGTMPLEALKEKTAFAANRRAERIPMFMFSPFHWVYADKEHAFVFEHGGPSDITIRLRPGFHILTNMHGVNDVDLDAAVKFLEIDADRDGIDEILERLKIILAHHEPLLAADHRICKHEGMPVTVSANLLAMHATDPGRSRWLYHEGSPCKNRWADVSNLLV